MSARRFAKFSIEFTSIGRRAHLLLLASEKHAELRASWSSCTVHPHNRLNHNPFDLIEAQLVAPAIVELRRARRGVVRHRGGLLERPAVLQIGRDPGRPETV